MLTSRAERPYLENRKICLQSHPPWARPRKQAMSGMEFTISATQNAR
jgi:hypothetical protein